MSPATVHRQLEILSIPKRSAHPAFARLALLVFLLSFAWGASAQTVAWTDSFLQGQAPTGEQCQNWTNFLNQLSQKTFASVTISGTFDGIGKTITDPV
ncbi:MAG TPA: hypothetical protein VFO54_07360, partial [Chryseosolibacter sp.]|nr:hypothetical protein [Chryseosolibacter sp.]